MSHKATKNHQYMWNTLSLSHHNRLPLARGWTELRPTIHRTGHCYYITHKYGVMWQAWAQLDGHLVDMKVLLWLNDLMDGGVGLSVMGPLFWWRTRSGYFTTLGSLIVTTVIWWYVTSVQKYNCTLTKSVYRFRRKLKLAAEECSRFERGAKGLALRISFFLNLQYMSHSSLQLSFFL